MKDYMKIYREWLPNPYFDEATKEESRTIEGGENETKGRPYADLKFGTAGSRGVIGVGINRMNICAIRCAAQGLANYTTEQGSVDKGVAIACDSHHVSPEFTMKAIMTLAANGIKTHKLESLCPTPELSFAVQELGCTAGISITASHNPSEYSDYKVYWEGGTQLTPSHDKGVTDEVLAIEGLSTIKTTDEVSVTAADKYQVIGKEVDDKCIAQVKTQVANQRAIDEMQDQIIIVYTPLHGTGDIPARRVMEEIGFTHVYMVSKQELSDGDLPTVDYPNSETEEAFALSLKLVREKDTDLILAADPDTDRLGVYVEGARSGNYTPLTSNMSDSLLCRYVFSQKQAAGEIPVDGQVTKSVVSTNLIDAVAKEYGRRLIEVLTGFKWIGQQVLKDEKIGRGAYLFEMGGSYGCLTGTYVKDKDAISVIAALCKAAAHYEQKGMTLQDATVAMYDEYGYYEDAVRSIGLPGIEGLAKAQSITKTLRVNTPEAVGSYRVISARDYRLDTIKGMTTGEVRPTRLPSPNVLYYDLNDGTQICVRPSGTGPKIKFHYEVKGSSMGDVEAKTEALGVAMMAMVDQMM